MRSLPVPQALWKALPVLMLLCSSLPMHAEAQTKSRTQTQTKAKAKAKSKKTKAKAKTPPAEPEKTPEAQKAPEEAPQKAAEPAPQKLEEPEKAPAPEKAPEKAPAQAKTPAQPKTPPKSKAPDKVVAQPKAPDRPLPQSQIQAQERAEAQSRMRIGVGLDLFIENSRMTGSQAINASRVDESFDYSSATFLSATLSMSVPAPVFKDRARIGGAVRLFGNYSAGGDRTFGFGLLGQALVTGEYGLPVANQLEVVFGARVGLALLLPGREFDQEIDRLQVQGVGVWSVPRTGWLGGLSAGVRRRMSEHILLRADLSGQLEKLYLFATNEDIEGLQFEKNWSTSGLRLGLTLGIEFAL
ncbi:hypothetical protein [Hyalangium gracile]|uniref:hypothetical protein n=1 Tax=Hyalangium gracile TaxID=394092 RepID=UPI001CCA9BDA|nr:hypothetical protein [Hyalangium gracile]